MTKVAAVRPRVKIRPSADVVAHDRGYEAYRLRQSGQDWAEIATTTGYASGRVAHMAVTAYLQKTALEQGPERRREALQTELDRLDRLQLANWSQAMAGDTRAGDLILKAIVVRARLLGLDRIQEPFGPPQHTVAIRGDSKEYIGALKSAIDGSTGPGEQR